MMSAGAGTSAELAIVASKTAVAATTEPLRRELLMDVLLPKARD